MIGDVTINEAVKMVRDSLVSHIDEIDQAFLKSDDKLDIALKVTLSLSDIEAGAIAIKQTIAFVAERVKDELVSTVSEKQTSMFSENEIE